MRKRNIWIVLAVCAVLLTGCQKAPAASEQESADPGQIVRPLPSAFSLSELDDCTFSASFSAADVGLNEDGALCITMTVYEYEQFDAVDISQLAVGDTIVMDGQENAVTDVEKDGDLVKINGGAEANGWDLYAGDGVYIPTVLDVGPVYHALGEVTLPLDQNFIYIDQSDPEKTETQYHAEDFLTEMENSSKYFSQQATLVCTEGGKIIELTQAYMP